MATSLLKPTALGRRTRTKLGRRNKTRTPRDNEDGALVSFRIHECRFMQTRFDGIRTVATSPSGRYIALARIDHSVELKDRDAKWSTISTVPADSRKKNMGFTAMEFSNCGSYVFAARANGRIEVFKVTIDGLVHHVSLTPGGGKIFDLVVCRDSSTTGFRLAVACADGRVRVITPDPSFFGAEGGQEFPTNTSFYETRMSEKSEACVTCVAWHCNSDPQAEECIAAGDKGGGVRWINPSTGSCYGSGKIPSGRQNRVIMKTIQFSRDGRQVLCGDSRGIITVWSSISNSISDEFQIDGLNGAILSSVARHHNASPHQQELGSSEVFVFGSESGELAAIRAVPDSEFWSVSRVRRFHAHKVRSIAALPNGSFVSSSIDSFLTIFRNEALDGPTPIKHVWPHYKCVGQSDVQVFPQKRAVLSSTSEVIEIWSFPRNSPSPVLALRMNLGCLSGLQSCAFNATSGTLALSTIDSFKIFNVSVSNSATIDLQSVHKVTPMMGLPETSLCLRGANDMVYCGDKLVCLSKCRRRIHLFDGARVHLLSILSPGMSSDTVFCKLSSHTKKFIASDSRGNVVVCTLSDEYKSDEGPLYQTRVLRCAQYGGKDVYVSAMAFSPSGTKAAVAYTDLSLCVLDLNGKGTQGTVFTNKEFVRLPHCLPAFAISVSFARTEDSLLISGSSFSNVLSLRQAADEGNKETNSSLKEFSLYDQGVRTGESICCSSVIGPTEVVIVSHVWSNLLESRPTTRKKRKFGT